MNRAHQIQSSDGAKRKNPSKEKQKKHHGVALRKLKPKTKRQGKFAKRRHTKEDKERNRRLQIQKRNPLYSKQIINPHPFHFVQESSACNQHAPNGKVFLLVLVACRPEEDKDRRWIRDTWGSLKAYRGRVVLVRFLVGRSRSRRAKKMIAEESALYGDIVQENFADTYRNLTHKVMMGLKWAARMCPKATYVMNLDSDMFVNVFRLVQRLEKAPRRNFAEGHLKSYTRPNRSRKYKWYTPVEMYPEKWYPPYLNGPAYVMSGDLPGRIFNESMHVRYLPWDDAFVGLVMQKLGVRPRAGRNYEMGLRNLKASTVLKVLFNSMACAVGHQRPANFVLRNIWGKFLKNYNNYTYSPPPDTKSRFNVSSLL